MNSERDTAPPGTRLLTGRRLRERLQLPARKGGLVISPLLDMAQVSETTVDLRLGTEFLISLRTRTPAIDTRPGADGPLDLTPFFERTFRDFGDPFVLYPMHFVLGCTFEYVRMPDDLCAELHSRSSLSRTGLGIRGFVQPGYMGVLTLELANDSGNSLVLYPGMRVVQLTFFELDPSPGAKYVKAEAAKYLGGTGPQISRIRREKDWDVLDGMRPSRAPERGAAAPELGGPEKE